MDNEKTNELISLFKEINSSLKVISIVAIKERNFKRYFKCYWKK